MKLSTIKYGKKAQRVNFGKIQPKVDVPNLLDIQVKSYDWLLTQGIDDIFNIVFPIVKQAADITKLEYLGCEFRESKYSLEEVRDKALTYSKPLFAKIRLQNGKTGEINDAHVFFGDFPIMTDKGTFLINGSERVIVSQLVRSAGIHFYEKRKPTTTEEEFIVIPTRGSWIEYVVTNKAPVVYKPNREAVVLTREQKDTNKYYVKLDRTKRLLVPTLLLGLGISIEDQIDLFGTSQIFQNTLTAIPDIQKDKNNFLEAKTNALYDIYSKIKPGEPATTKGVVNLLKSKFFDPTRYDLAGAGRYKFNSKLAVWKRIAGTRLADDIKLNKKVVVKKGTYLDATNFAKAKKALMAGANMVFYQSNDMLNTTDSDILDKKRIKLDHEEIKLQVVKVFPNEDTKVASSVIGNWQKETKMHITISDIIASFSYLINLKENELTKFDDVDNLANRRIKHVGELVQNQFRIGLTRIQKNILEKITSVEADKMTPKNLINIKPLTSSIREFFLSSQLSQFMDQTNPQSELSNKRRISALGPGGLSRNFAGTDVRDVNPSHYGRICPIETPEGPNVGLINNLALYARVNQFGFIETPYALVEKKGTKFIISDKVEYLSAEDERDYVIGGVNINVGKNGQIKDKEIVARLNGETNTYPVNQINYVAISAQQILSIASSCIPFLEHDDATRAAMGANMQRQAVPLLSPQAPIIGTGLEHIAAKYSGAALISENSGTVLYVDSTKIIIKTNKNQKIEYKLDNFDISNQGTLIHQIPIVKKGEKITKGQIIADGPSMEEGELALGANVKVAFSTWNGYNYEDAIIISERLVKDDVYTSIHISEYILESRSTPQGEEEITAELPNVAAKSKKFLDQRGIITVGSSVKQGDILVGKVSPKAQVTTSPEEKLIRAIFGDKSKNIKETSMRVPHGAEGVVQSVKVFTSDDLKLPPGVNTIVKVYIAQKRKIQEGDKMAGRHGNKGVISVVLPEEDMPIMEDGTPIDILLNPLGVPSRMNIGQILEIHLGIAAEKLGIKVATPGFDGCSIDELTQLMQEAKIDLKGKFKIRDGKTGKYFDKPISVGTMYMLKLSHMVDDKMHSRSTGPYSIITQQPLGGKAQKGGQRFGEMEVWALEAYGAAHTLQELLTVKSDDIAGRSETYNSILYNKELPDAGIPESFAVLQKELQALSLNLEIELKKQPKEENQKEEK